MIIAVIQGLISPGINIYNFHSLEAEPGLFLIISRHLQSKRSHFLKKTDKQENTNERYQCSDCQV